MIAQCERGSRYPGGCPPAREGPPSYPSVAHQPRKSGGGRRRATEFSLDVGSGAPSQKALTDAPFYIQPQRESMRVQRTADEKRKK